MSTAYFPTNMRQQSSGGYSNKSTNENIPYIPWKGTGVFSNPVGITATPIRPLTNLDPGNVFPTGFGLPRPLKQYRKGTVTPIHFETLSLNPQNTLGYVEKSLIEYNVNRAVKSSLSSSLGGGNGGTGLISQTMEMPGYYIVKDNKPITINNEEGLDFAVETDIKGLKIGKDCQNCNGYGLVSSWYPINNLTEKPEPVVTNPLLCCNQQRKAYQRTLPTNTNIPKKYFQSSYMYLYNRCQTFKQRQFNFVTGTVDKAILDLFLAYPFVTAKVLQYTQPGDPLSILNYYVAQCNPNFVVEASVEIGFINSLSHSLLQSNYISKADYDSLLSNSGTTIQSFIQSLQSTLTPETYALVNAYLYQLAANPYNGSVLTGPSNPKGCAQVIYKPNNPQFAKQGGVSSSTRTLKLNVDTISTAAAQQNILKGYNLNKVMSLQYANPADTPFILKDKVPPCQPQTYVGNPFFFQGQHQNKLICRTNTNGAEYHTYNSLNNGSAGNYIGATQPGGAGYVDTSRIPNTTYFDNIFYSKYRK